MSHFVSPVQLANGITAVLDFYADAVRKYSPFFDDRPDGTDVSLLVIHNISLPPGQFGGPGIEQLFTGRIDPQEHDFYREIAHLQVSAHCVVHRTGEVVQFVPFSKRAWHAGKSSFQGCSRCNDFAIGIEMEGADDVLYTDAQYQSLEQLTQKIIHAFPLITLGRIVGHSDIAPGRKTDPGPAFDWPRYRQSFNIKDKPCT